MQQQRQEDLHQLYSQSAGYPQQPPLLLPPPLLPAPASPGTPAGGHYQRQSVARFSAPGRGAGFECSRASVSRSSMPAVSSTLRRRTPDPQLINSWCDGFSCMCRARLYRLPAYLTSFSPPSFCRCLHG